MDSGDVPIIGTPSRCNSKREVERSLAAELHDDAEWFFLPDNVNDVFEGQRLEIQTIRRVVIRRHRLRIAIDHDGFKTLFLEGERCMAAAIIEFNSLPDPIGSAAENHDLLSIRRLGLVFFFVRRIKVRRVGFEFRGAGVDALVHRNDSVLRALSAICAGVSRAECVQARIGKSERFPSRSNSAGNVSPACSRKSPGSGLGNFLHFVEEPRIDARQ